MQLKLVAIAVLLLIPALALAGRGDALVHAQVFADTYYPQPGTKFRVGVLLSIEPGWHIYWKNPGDSGLPTKLTFHLPQGYTVGPVQYPLPKKLVLPGDIVNYVYEDKVMLFAYVTASPQMRDDLISVDVNWLVCNEVCLPGKTTLSMHLDEQHSNPDVFKQWLPNFPAHRDAEHVAAITSHSDQTSATIVVQWKQQPPGDITLFPPLIAGFEINSPTVETTGLQTTIHYSATPTSPTAGSIAIDGLLEYTVANGQRLGLTLSKP